MSQLENPKRRRGDVAQMARCIGVSRRTLYAWVRASTRSPTRRVGRPGATATARRAALRAVVRLYREGVRVSWRSVKARIGARFPTRLLQEATARFKRHHARHVERQRARLRVKVTVHRPDVIWGMDGTHLGRTADAKPVDAQVLRDAASRCTLALAVGRPASAADVVAILERVRLQVGTLPRVLCTDNGPIYTSTEVAEYLERHQVIHLLNVPHTPQHNAFTERGIGELKELAELGKGVVLASVEDAADRLERARHYLDHCHARPVLHGRTAAMCYQRDRARYRMPDRDLFYWTTRYALDVASKQPTARLRRRAQREAIYASLELFGLISRTRGGVPFRAVMCEGIS